jgi:hypothetical protein
MNIEKSRTQEIVRLHSEIGSLLRQSLEKAIRIGQLLSEQKQTLKHGEFIPWLKANIPFAETTARNYMRLYRERDRLKTATVAGLKEAYALLASPPMIPVEELSAPEESFNPDEWFEIIKGVNETFFPNNPEYKIDTEPGKIFEFMQKINDGSTTEREDMGFALWGNFHTHLCYWINYAKANSKDGLHPKMRRYLDNVMEDKPDWINGSYRICGERCGVNFNLLPPKRKE